MSAPSAPAHRGGPSPARGGAPGFGAALAAERLKFFALPTTRWILGGLVVVTVGVSVLIVFFGGGSTVAVTQQGHHQQYNIVFFGASLGTIAYTYLSALFFSSEFRTGLADYTFTVTPRRLRVLLAKTVLIAGVGLVVGMVVSFVNAGITQGVLALGGFPTLSFSDPTLWRVLVLYIGLSFVVQGCLGGFFGLLVRNPFGAVVIAVLIDALPPSLAQYFGPTFSDTVPRWIPGAAVESVSGVADPAAPGYLPLPLGILALVLWVGVIGTIAFRRVIQADAR